MNCPDISICRDSIPDDLLKGKTRNEITNFSNVQFHDVQNCSMFRDGSVDNMIFQRDIQIYRHQRSKYLKTTLKTNISLANDGSTIPCSKSDDVYCTPSTCNLETTVKRIVQQAHQRNEIDSRISSWNSLFHEIIELCDITTKYPLDRLPECYKKGNDCGHVEHVNLENSTIKTLYLTILDHLNKPENKVSSNTASYFVHYVIYHNPVWDLGLQHKLLSKNYNKDYSTSLINIQTYSNNCVCPCSAIFKKWHEAKGIIKMIQFKQCDSPIFTNTSSFVKHVYSRQDCYYHHIVMRIIQNTYSPLISKLEIKDEMKKDNVTSFSLTHDIQVKLPPYITSKYEYQSYRFEK